MDKNFLQKVFNQRLRQVVFFAIIVVIAIVLIYNFKTYIPGVLLAITFYILTRTPYFKLTIAKGWNKSLTAILFIVGLLLILFGPIYLGVKMLIPQIENVFSNKDQIVNMLTSVNNYLQEKTGIELTSDSNIKSAVNSLVSAVPSVLGSAATTLANIFMAMFIYYFMLIGGRKMEKTLKQIIPLKPENLKLLGTDTKTIVTSSALGVPMISIIQGIAAGIGYYIFGVENWGMWAFITGVFAFFPIVGTMIIWVPLCIYLAIQGHTWQAIGLAVYCIVIVGNIDYVFRMTIMKKWGNIPPLISVIGVIIGLNMFGFIGVIFGPLLLSYFFLFIKIYINEFSTSDNEDTSDGNNSGSDSGNQSKQPFWKTLLGKKTTKKLQPSNTIQSTAPEKDATKTKTES